MAGRDRHGSMRGIVVAALVIALGTLAACGGGSDKKSASSSSTKAASSAATDESSSSTKSSSSAAGGSFDCPSDADVSAIVGEQMEFDKDAPVQASFFCPYRVKGDTESLGTSVSLTFSKIDLTQDDGGTNPEEVSGVGQRARWNSGIDELAVWTGDHSVLVDVLFYKGDKKAVAIKLAELGI